MGGGGLEGGWSRVIVNRIDIRYCFARYVNKDTTAKTITKDSNLKARTMMNDL